MSSRRRSPRLVATLLCVLALAASGCAEKGAKTTRSCGSSADCGGDICFESTCYAACTAQQQCAADEICVHKVGSGDEQADVCVVASEFAGCADDAGCSALVEGPCEDVFCNTEAAACKVRGLRDDTPCVTDEGLDGACTDGACVTTPVVEPEPDVAEPLPEVVETVDVPNDVPVLAGPFEPCTTFEDCESKLCVDDGDGGHVCSVTCQNDDPCQDGWTCQLSIELMEVYLCLPHACEPDCSGRDCGDDGCGGSCGTCESGLACTTAGTCGLDTDGDGQPDDEDADDDNDGHADDLDNCPQVANGAQADLDDDGEGDACDPDDDDDGVLDDADNCPDLANESQADLDGDDEGDDCDLDDDDDGWLDTGDNCPTIANEAQDDLDVDGLGDACDDDRDGDGDPDASDCAPADETVGHLAAEWCDALDNDCDGTTDLGCDDDADGFCDADILTVGAPAACPSGGGDCDDGEAGVHPGATEICGNELDDDCLGGDAACPPTCLDQDGDEYGSGQACLGPDCNDDDAAVHPGATEACNTLDDDCNAATDDGPDVCPAGLTCVGGSCVCVPACGDRVCGDDGCGGSCGTCAADDACHEATCLDGQCDISPLTGTGCDDGDACTLDDLCLQGLCAGQPVDCSDDLACTLDTCEPLSGACQHEAQGPDTDRDGLLDCVDPDDDNDDDPDPTDCDPLSPAVRHGAPELCNGVDDDCDALTDDEVPVTDCVLDNELGSCPGTSACIEGQVVCQGAPAAPEACNGVDDDCDALTDEDQPADACTIDNEVGSCPGTTACVEGQVVCQGAPAVLEACDALDNDCDGQTDEDYTDTDDDTVADCVDPDDDNDDDPDPTDCAPLDATVGHTMADTIDDVGQDDNCDGIDGVDTDQDGVASQASGGQDCDDTDPGVNPSVLDLVDGTCSPSVFLAADVGALPEPSTRVSAEVAPDGTLGVLADQGGRWVFARQVDADWTAEEVLPSTYLLDTASCPASLAIDPKGTPRVACVAEGPNGAALVLATRGTTGWTIDEIAPWFGACGPLSLAVSVGGLPSLAYAAPAEAAVRYAEVNDGDWGVSTVASDVADIAFVSLALDDASAPWLAYADGAGILWVGAREGGEWWPYDLASGAVAGSDRSLAFGADGRAHLAWVGDVEGSLELRFSSDTGDGWSTRVVQNLLYGLAYPVLRFDSVGQPHLGLCRGPLEVSHVYPDGREWHEAVRGVPGYGTVAAPHLGFVLGLADRPHFAVGVTCASTCDGHTSVKHLAGACGDARDLNCDGVDGQDDDFDGYASTGSGGGDCDDADWLVHPGADDLVGDGLDQNCDGLDGVDGDRDGYASLASNGDDCDDADVDLNPGALDLVAGFCTPGLDDQITVAVLPLPAARVTADLAPDGRLGIVAEQAGRYRFATTALTTAWVAEDVAPTTDLVDAGACPASLAFDAYGGAHVAYVASRDGVTSLYHAARSTTGAWTIEVAAPWQPGEVAATCRPLSIAIDDAANVAIAFATPDDQGLGFATNGSGAWEPSTVAAAEGGARFVSLAFDGAVPVIAFADGLGALTLIGNYDGWISWPVATLAAGGSDRSLVIGADGRAAIAWVRDDAGSLTVQFSFDTGDGFGSELVTWLSYGLVHPVLRVDGLGVHHLGLVPNPYEVVHQVRGVGGYWTTYWGAPTGDPSIERSAAGGFALLPGGRPYVVVGSTCPVACAGDPSVAIALGRCGSELDTNCDGADGIDLDRDGHAAPWTGGDDCNDDDATIHPAAPEVCNGLDDDCDGQVDQDGADLCAPGLTCVYGTCVAM